MEPLCPSSARAEMKGKECVSVMGKLIIDGNSVYEIDEACIERKGRQEKEQQARQEMPKRRQYPERSRRGI